VFVAGAHLPGALIKSCVFSALSPSDKLKRKAMKIAMGLFCKCGE
jgi:hypothetical protein